MAAGALAALVAADLGLLDVVSYQDDTAWLVLAAAAVFGAAFLTRLKPLAVAATLALAALWLCVAFTPLSRWAAAGLVRRDPLRAADAIVVLGSRLQDDGEPTTAAMSRLLWGLQLLAEGRAPRLILTELPKPSKSYALIARGWMLSFGVEGELIDLGPVRSTHDEAAATGDLYRRRGYRTLILVTSPTHTRRAAATFEHEGIEVIASPSLETKYDLESLDTPRERLDAFGSILHERVGIWIYARRGWLVATSR